MELVDRYILFHPVKESHSMLKEKAENAHGLLFEMYQQIGGLTIEDCGK